jgi:protein tyrosine/serine phosphatase
MHKHLPLLIHCNHGAGKVGGWFLGAAGLKAAVVGPRQRRVLD